jgi:hypothetical protein
MQITNALRLSKIIIIFEYSRNCLSKWNIKASLECSQNAHKTEQMKITTVGIKTQSKVHQPIDNTKMSIQNVVTPNIMGSG